MKKKMVKVGNGDIWVNAANVSFIEDDVVVMSNKHRYKASEEALCVIKAEMAASELRKAEILEVVCKLYADGFTGNKIIKAIGNAVTYNTDAVTEGDIYCVSYRDGGFYVGLRTTEDYEPKEGDWWCISCNTQNQPYKPYPSSPIVLNNVCPNDSYIIVYDKASHIIFAGTNTNVDSGYYITIQAYVNGSYTAGTTSKTNATDLMWPVRSVTIGNKITFRTGKNVDNIQTDFGINVLTAIGPTCFLMKPISASDILAYNATGHMGWLMFGEELEVSSNTSYNANKQFRIKNNVKYAVVYYDADNNQVEVDFASNNRHGSKCTMYNNDDNIYNIYATEKIGTGSNAIYVYQLDFESHYQDGVMERQITSEKRVEGETGAYHHIKVFPVLQDNRPATLNALNTNLLNSNQTDVQPINDETDG